MPTAQPRINIAMEPALYEAVTRLAREENVSLSTAARRLMREALELMEDRALAEWAGEREKTFRRSEALSHEEAWGKLPARRGKKPRSRR